MLSEIPPFRSHVLNSVRMKKIIVFILLAITHGVAAQVDLKKLDAYYTKALKDWEMPGMSIAIVKDGKVVFSKGYGVKEVGKNEKTDENTLYAIASNTKAFTTAAIAMMVQEGKLSWDDKVKKYLPYFELYDPYVSREVTIRDILSHRVGLRTFSGDAIWYLSDNLPASEIIKRAKYLPRSYDFRSGYGYSNVMYITAGELMRVVSNKSWADNIQDRILNPLNMNRTITTVKQLEQKGNFATPHGLFAGKHQSIAWEDWESIAATGGIVSSVQDMANWMLFNLNRGIWKDDTLLTRASRNMLWMPHNTFQVDHTLPEHSTHFRGYALGWNVSDYHGRMRVSHTGGYSGMLSMVLLVPDENLGIVVLTNGMKPLFSAIANYTMDRFLKLPEKDWSADLLKNYSNRVANDQRIPDIKRAHVTGTKPSVGLDKVAGVYAADIYGNIEVKQEGEKLRLYFEHSKRFSATLEHWHYDTWEIKWDNADLLSWFSFGTVHFILDNNLKVKALEFDVPNDDIWFDELKPMKVQ